MHTCVAPASVALRSRFTKTRSHSAASPRTRIPASMRCENSILGDARRGSAGVWCYGRWGGHTRLDAPRKFDLGSVRRFEVIARELSRVVDHGDNAVQFARDCLEAAHAPKIEFSQRIEA